jgi:septin family protein
MSPGLKQRELTVIERESRIKETEDRLSRSQAQLEAERLRVQETLAKIELHMKDGRRQVEVDQWRVTQDAARLQVRGI